MNANQDGDDLTIAATQSSISPVEDLIQNPNPIIDINPTLDTEKILDFKGVESSLAALKSIDIANSNNIGNIAF